MNFITIISALAVFLLVVLFHELGHFLVAKAVNIKVNEFSIGMGPAIVQSQKGETEYSLRAIPLGGYCAMEGEDEDSADPRGFDQAKPWQRFFTILAGPIMNILTAVLLFSIYAAMMGQPVPVVDEFTENSVLAEAGLEEGDEITAINGVAVEGQEHLRNIVQEHGSEMLTITYEKPDGTSNSVDVQAQEQDGRYLIGFIARTVRDNPINSIKQGFKMTWTTFIQLFQILGMLFSGQLGMDAVSGPVGVISTIGQAASNGLMPLIFLTGYISVNLAFFNLLPIPALDGSKLLFIIIEKLRGKPVNKELETKITMVGFAFLLGLIVLISIKDIINIF